MKNLNKTNLHDIISNFKIQGEIEQIDLFGSGHINITYHLKNKLATCPDYLLQSINHEIFTNVPSLISNILIVTTHLKSKVQENDNKPDAEVLTLIAACSGFYYHIDTDGNYWRMYYFIKNAKSYNIVQTEEQAYHGGMAFGRFQQQLSDLNAKSLTEMLPNFHNIQRRLRQLLHVIVENREKRVNNVKAEIEFIKSRAHQMSFILQAGEDSALPLRIIHNDTKFNNLLFNANDECLCVIDLDTVMPGYIAYDFGDAIRTIINTANEDEVDLKKIDLNISLFKAYASGYLKSVSGFITDTEINSLMKGVLLLPYIQMVRFLTDYIQGDTYYKTIFPDHNLIRTRTQMRLLIKLEERYDLLDQIVKEIASECHQPNTK